MLPLHPLHRARIITVVALCTLALAACRNGNSTEASTSTTPTTTPAATDSVHASTTIAPAASTTASAASTDSTAASATTEQIVDTLPPTLPKDNSVHPSNYAKCSGSADVSDSGDSTIVGLPLSIAGFEDRPTYLQDGAGPDAPLVVLFHGQNGCVANLQSRTDLDSIANARGVNLLWLSGAPLPTRSWRVNNHCCEPASHKGADDLGYVDAALDEIEARGLHPTRIVSAGVSNGAGMALTVACLRSSRFDAAVSVAGWLPVTCRTKRPVSLLAFGGTKDEVFPASMPKNIAGRWRRSATECPDAPERIKDELRQITTWRQCRNNTVVRLVSLPDVPHVWPKYTFYDMDEEIITMALDGFASR